MKTVVLVGLISLGCLTVAVATNSPVRPDTTAPNRTPRLPKQAILPGYSLDTSFNSLAKPDPAVYRVVPKWLRAKATGKPVYVIDGQVARASQLKYLKASAVESVNVIDGKLAVSLYGPVAREGVVAITTKSALLPRKR